MLFRCGMRIGMLGNRTLAAVFVLVRWVNRRRTLYSSHHWRMPALG